MSVWHKQARRHVDDVDGVQLLGGREMALEDN